MPHLDHRQLLCTFTNNRDFRETEIKIRKFYEIYNNKIFAFSNEKNPAEIYLTYNAINCNTNFPKLQNTILIHRKKEFNVLYSLNALNVLIKEENGVMDKSFILDWKLYANSLVITGDISVKIIPLKLFSLK